jgi:hypothetical protein
MRKIIVLAIAAIFMCLAAAPALADVTIKNNTAFRLDIVLMDTRTRQNQALNPNEKESFRCQPSGGRLIVLKKGEEMAKTYFEDGDKFVILVEGDKIVLKKDRNL